MTLSITARPFSAATWVDFEALFGKQKGVRSGCWCTFHRCTSSEYNRMTCGERHDFQKGLTEAGRGYGLLVYEGDVPVA